MKDINVIKTRLSEGPVARKGYHWNMQPENPYGTEMLYIQWPGGLEREARIMVCGIDGTRQRIAVDDGDFLAGVHVGAMTHWIGDSKFVHRGPRGKDDIVVRSVTDGSVVRRIDCGSCGPVDYNEETGLILTGYSASRQCTAEHGDVWTVDPVTGGKNKILDVKAFEPWREKMGGRLPNSIWHRYWNSSGTRILALVEPHPKYDFTFAVSGENIRFFPYKTGQHSSWWDDERVYRSGKLFELGSRDTGIVVARTENHLCHSGYSPDRNWVAGESGYGSDPVVMSVDYFGPEGVRMQYELDHTEYVEWIWERRFHVDASFSRDGSRIYVNWPISGTEMGVFSYDISSLKLANRRALENGGAPAGPERVKLAVK